MISRGLTKTWLAFAKAFVPGMKLKLKPKPNRPLGGECPVDPSWLAIIKTPPGESPPLLGAPLPTFKQCIKQNRCNVGNLSEVDLDCIYTIEYYTSFADFIKFKLTGIPLLGDISLDTFFPSLASVPGAAGMACYFHEQYDEKGGLLVPPPENALMTGAMLVHVSK